MDEPVTLGSSTEPPSAMPSPLEELQAVKRMLEAEGDAQRRRLRELGIPDFVVPAFTQGFNGA